jgi:hypothetical protein
MRFGAIRCKEKNSGSSADMRGPLASGRLARHARVEGAGERAPPCSDLIGERERARGSVTARWDRGVDAELGRPHRGKAKWAENGAPRPD